MMLEFFYVAGTFVGGKARVEACLRVEVSDELTDAEKGKVRSLLCDFAHSDELSEIPFIKFHAVEIGQRFDVESPLSKRLVALCHTIGIRKVQRIEQSLRYKDRAEERVATLDPETEVLYMGPFSSFTERA